MSFKALAHKYLLIIFVLAIGIALLLTLAFEEPLTYLQNLLAGELYVLSVIAYTVLMLLSVIFSPITFAPTVPFAAKIMGSGPVFVSVMTAWIVGSLTLFLIARYRGSLVRYTTDEQALGHYAEKLPKKLDTWSLLTLRLFSPIDLLSVAVARQKKVSLPSFMLATVFGIIPLAFVLSYSADALSDNDPILLFIFLTLLGLILFSYLLYNSSYFSKPKAIIVTHSGKFHTDDVFAVAVLLLILEQSQRRYQIIRTRDEAVIEKYQQMARDPVAKHDVYVLDIGNAYEKQFDLFDHHQSRGAGSRENGIEYATLGLVWEKYGKRLVNGSELVKYIDEKFVQNIDAPDNGRMTYKTVHPDLAPLQIQDIVGKFHKPLYDNEDFDSQFIRSVEFAKALLPRIFAYYEQKLVAREAAGSVYANATDKRVMIDDSYVPATEFARFAEPLLVVTPRDDGKWQILTVREESDDMTTARIAFPEPWWGLRDRELEQVSGVKGAIFCHRSGDFLTVSSTKETALELAFKTINHAEIAQAKKTEGSVQ